MVHITTKSLFYLLKDHAVWSILAGGRSQGATSASNFDAKQIHEAKQGVLFIAIF